MTSATLIVDEESGTEVAKVKGLLQALPGELVQVEEDKSEVRYRVLERMFVLTKSGDAVEHVDLFLNVRELEEDGGPAEPDNVNDSEDEEEGGK